MWTLETTYGKISASVSKVLGNRYEMTGTVCTECFERDKEKRASCHIFLLESCKQERKDVSFIPLKLDPVKHRSWKNKVFE